jgi:hypothetical protein
MSRTGGVEGYLVRDAPKHDYCTLAGSCLYICLLLTLNIIIRSQHKSTQLLTLMGSAEHASQNGYCERASCHRG